MLPCVSPPCSAWQQWHGYVSAGIQMPQGHLYTSAVHSTVAQHTTGALCCKLEHAMLCSKYNLIYSQDLFFFFLPQIFVDMVPSNPVVTADSSDVFSWADGRLLMLHHRFDKGACGSSRSCPFHLLIIPEMMFA